jgi:uncharacterized alpha-E superfamily protein
MARHRQANIMLSRVAGSLYWMSRYLERAENQARLIDVNLQILLDFGRVTDEALKQHWVPVLKSSGDESLFFSLYSATYNESVTEFLTFRRDNPNSLFSCISSARESARQVRDQISAEMWEVLNDAYLFVQSADARKLWGHDGAGASAFYDQIKRYSHLFQGITHATFSRNEGFDFIEFGKYLERADKITRLLDIKYHILLPKASDVGGAVDAAQWHAVLRSASGLEAYRRFYVADILVGKVVEFLLAEQGFPRSLVFCLEQIESLMRKIDNQDLFFSSAAGRNCTALLERLRRLRVEDVFEQGLHQFLTEAQRTVADAGAHVYGSYMDHPPVDMAAEIRFHQQQEQQQQ